MFNRARVKLTGWYLLISMIISLFFSGLIYREANIELNRFVEAQRMRFERRWEMPPILVDEELINETRQRFIWRLVVLNLAIGGIVGVAGYYLSGKVLYPIKVMVKEQERFISDAAHELKTPLTAIKTNLEVELREEIITSQDAKKILAIELEEINKLQKLSESLLTLSRGTVEEEKDIIEIKELVETIVRELSPIAEGKKVSVVIKGKTLLVQINRDGMKRALVAVVENAIKYSDGGGRVKIAWVVRGSKLVIKISDTGKGIASEEMWHVFDRFYRSDKSRHTEGYGLGLSIAKQLIEQQGGNITIESEVGKGTKLIITIPYSASLQRKS